MAPPEHLAAWCCEIIKKGEGWVNFKTMKGSKTRR